VDTFLRTFIDDMISVRKSLVLTVQKECRKWYGMLHFGRDIAASNHFSGFKEGFGFANLPCRISKIEKYQLYSIHQESQCIISDKVSHAIQFHRIEMHLNPK
jgi:hypothetical protein